MWYWCYVPCKEIITVWRFLGLRSKGGLFDVTMCAYDGTEVFELVGSYMLNILSKKYKKQF